MPQVQDKSVTVGVRPEDLSVSLNRIDSGIWGTSSVTESLGSDNYLHVDTSGVLFSVRLKRNETIPEERPIWLVVHKEQLHLFHKSTGRRIP